MKILKPFLPCDYLNRPFLLKTYYSICAMYKEFCFRKRMKAMTDDDKKYLINVVSYPPNNEFYYSSTIDELKNNMINGELHIDMTELDRDNFQIFIGSEIQRTPLVLVLHFVTCDFEETLRIRPICNMSLVRNTQTRQGWSIY